MKAYVERYADGLISELFGSVSAISVLGPRACGKTTTAKRHTDGLWSLDTPSEASAFKLDPDLALTSRPEPLLIDEWQEAPEALGALKRSVDANPSPRRFMLTGSIRAETETDVWPGTGRLINVAMGPLTQRELAGKADSPLFLDTLRQSATLEDFVENTSGQKLKNSKEYGLADYLSLSEVGGFPTPAFSGSNRVVQHWYESYLELKSVSSKRSFIPSRSCTTGCSRTKTSSYLERFATHSSQICSSDFTLRSTPSAVRRI